MHEIGRIKLKSVNGMKIFSKIFGRFEKFSYLCIEKTKK